MWKYSIILILYLVISSELTDSWSAPVSQELKSEYFMARVNDSTLGLNQRILAIDSLLNLSKKPDASLEWKRGDMAWEGDMHDTVIESYEKWLSVDTNQTEDNICKALYRMAMASYKQGLYENSAQ